MEESKKSSKKFLAIYSIAIFIFAVSMILIAAFSYDKVNDYAQGIKDQFEAENSAVESNLQAVTLKNQQLEEQIKTLTAEKEAAEKKLIASQKLTEILNYKAQDDTKKLYEAIGAFNALEYSKFLSPADLEIYNALQ